MRWLRKGSPDRIPASAPEGVVRPNDLASLRATMAVHDRVPLPARGGPWLLRRDGFGGALGPRVRFVFPLWYFGTATLLMAAVRAGWAMPWRWGVVVAMAAALPAAAVGLETLSVWRTRRRAKRLLRATSTDGDVVRVEGRVEEQGTFNAPFSGRPCVVVRNSHGFVDETRGVDFVLRNEAGEAVRVLVAGAALLDAPVRVRRRGAWRLREATIEPGDLIEAIGVLEHEVAADVEALPGRGSRLGRLLRAPHDGALLIRLVGGRAGAPRR